MSWQTIDSAPMDGSKVLLCYPGFLGDKKQCIASWSKNMRMNGSYGDNAWIICDTLDAVTPRPTHWMRLPEPPK